MLKSCGAQVVATVLLAILSGGSYAIALRADGTGVAWGNSTTPAVPSNLGPCTAVEAGLGIGAAIRSG